MRPYTLSLCLLALTMWAPAAHAFEREWHLGAAAGGALPPGSYELGPALGAYAAYGISDVFDVRLELAAARHGTPDGPTVGFFSGAVGLMYKIDIIRWVPWGGVLGGYNLSSPSPEGPEPLPERSGAVGFALGLDYAVTRNFGLGVSVREDLLLVGGDWYGSLLLRAEYRFGW